MSYVWIDIESSQVQAGLSVFQILYQSKLYSQKNFHIVGFCGFCTIEGNVNDEFEEKSEKLNFSIQNRYWKQISLFAMIPLLAPIAQLVDHLASKQEVVSSSPSWSKIFFYDRVYVLS